MTITPQDKAEVFRVWHEEKDKPLGESSRDSPRFAEIHRDSPRRISSSAPSIPTTIGIQCRCGTGTCAVMASLWARGELGLDEDFVHESILGTTFRGRLLKETTVEEKGGSGSSGSGSGSGSRAAVVPKIAGRAWITQICAVVRDPSDPFPEGYTVGDIWAA